MGTLMKLVGEKAIGPFLVELEKDNLKMTRIKEFSEKAVIIVKVPGVKKQRPTTAPAKVVVPKTTQETARPPARKPAGKTIKCPVMACIYWPDSLSRLSTYLSIINHKVADIRSRSQSYS